MKLIAIVRGVSYGSLCVLLLLIAYAIAVAFYSGHAKSPDFISGAPYRQHVDCTHWPVHQDREWVKVLALKGGGVHGLIELGALQYLETKTGKKTYELFDLISGTSTGAIIAVALTTPDKQGEPRYSAAEMFRHYQRLGPELLTAPLYHKLLTVGGIFGPSLPSGPLDRAFRTMLGDKVRFDQQLTNVMISTFNLGAYRTEFFRSWECNPETPAYYSHEVVSAAVATPAFFPPVVIRDIQNNYQRPYVDALVSVNDPTFIAFREAVKMFPGRKYLVLTLFSGKEVTRLSEVIVQHWGVAQWVPSLIPMFLAGGEYQVNVTMEFIKDYAFKDRLLVEGFNVTLPAQAGNPFDVSPEAMSYVVNAAQNLVNERKEDLDRLAAFLAAH